MSTLNRLSVTQNNQNIQKRKILFPDNSVDAFGRLAVASPVSIFDSKLTTNEQSRYWTDTLTSNGTATYDNNLSAMKLDVTTVSGDKVTRSTNECFNYQAGKGQGVFITFVMATPQTNLVQRVGQFNVNDGLFFEYKDDTLYAVKRSSTSGSPVDTKIEQSQWNYDKMDGTGVSGVTIDVTKTNIAVIQYQWLGVGAVTFAWDIDGVLFPCHVIKNANYETNVYIRTPNNPVTYEIENTGTTAGASQMRAICCNVFSSGGSEPRTRTRGFDMGGDVLSVGSASFIPVLSIRKNTASINETARLLSYYLVVATNDDIIYRIVLNPTLTTPDWAATVMDGGDGYIEADTAATSTTGGELLLTSGGSQNQSAPTSLAEGVKILTSGSTSDIISIQAISTATNANVAAGINWEEIL